MYTVLRAWQEQPNLQAPLFMRTRRLRTCTLESVERTTTNTELIALKGNLEVTSNRHFWLMLENKSILSKMLQMYTTLTELMERPKTLMNMMDYFQTEVLDGYVKEGPYLQR